MRSDKFKVINKDTRIMCDALRDLVPFVQLKTVKGTHGGGLLLVTLPRGCFSRFLNCINGTKSRKASHVKKLFMLLRCC